MFDFAQFDQYSAQDIQQWLDRVAAGQEQVLDSFDWHMFGYLTTNTFLETDALEWARLALQGYDLQWQFLAAKSDDWERLRLLQPAMRIRAHLIAESGPHPGDPLFDLDALVRWAEGWIAAPLLQGASQRDPSDPTMYDMRQMVLEALQPLAATTWLDQHPLLLRALKQQATP